MILAAGRAGRTRRQSLAAMIDVVFLLIFFFMLAARYGVEMDVPVDAGRAGEAYSGAPRLVEIGPGSLALNGRPIDETRIAGALSDLVETPDDAVIVAPRGDASTARLVEVLTMLRAAGFARLVLVP